jgi:hypothetical protein
VGPDWKNSLTGSICGSLQELYKFECRNKRFSIPKLNPTGIRNHNKWTQKGTKTSKITFNDTLSEQGRTSIEKGCRKGVRGASFRKPFEDRNPENITKNASQKTSKNQSWENIKSDDKTMPKGNQKSSIFQFYLRRGNFRQLSVLLT